MIEGEPQETFEEDEELLGRKTGNTLSLWGNLSTMNLNNMIYTNIMQSPYFKTELIELKTYHEVIDEIYYKVEHLEPWERGSRRTAGQTGMCGGVRGVGAGGIVSTAFCLLYKLFTLKLTRKQLKGLLDHPDSPYIRALGFMYIRYCLNPQDLWDWYKDYLDDGEELDVKAGGGCTMTIGEMLVHYLTKLDWFSTLFPRIPVPIQKKLEVQLRDHRRSMVAEAALKKEEETVAETAAVPEPVEAPDRGNGRDRGADAGRERDRSGRDRERHSERDRERPRERGGERDRERDRDRERERDRGRDRERDRERDRLGFRDRERDRERGGRERRDDKERVREKERRRERSRERRSRSRERRSRERGRPRDEPRRARERSDSFERDLRRERERQARRS